MVRGERGKAAATIKTYFYFLKMNAKSLLLITFFISFSSLAMWMGGLERDLNGVKPGVSIAGREVERLLPGEVQQVVMELALQHHRLPVEPSIDKASGKIIPEKEGYLLDVVTCQEMIMKAPAEAQLEVPLIPVKARHSGLELAAAQEVVGQYQTWVSGSAERSKNVALAARGINNILLWPGERFSFNDMVGPRTLERGYLPAPIFLMGASAMDYGGGVCQVASTIYNAAVAAGLRIDERHAHTRPVHYVPEGRDATVAYPYLDLRFTNVKEGPLIVKSGLSGGRLWVKIMGRSK